MYCVLTHLILRRACPFNTIAYFRDWAQEGKVTCLRSYAHDLVELGFEPFLSLESMLLNVCEVPSRAVFKEFLVKWEGGGETNNYRIKWYSRMLRKC